MAACYLDHAATTEVRPEVMERVATAMTECFGNPSSLHAKGLEAESLLRRAREQVAAGLGVDPGGIIFTSGGTEANNLALKGAARAARRRGGRIVASAIEHPSVLAVLDDLREDGFETVLVPVDGEGRVDLEALTAAVDGETLAVSVMAVNNEIGSVQPIEEIVRRVKGKEKRVLVHVDAVQAFGKVPLRPVEAGVDLLSLSGHKLHGPKGVGALYVAPGVRLRALLAGGQQEGGLRSGTENVPGIVGLGEAVRLAVAEFEAGAVRMRRQKLRLWEALLRLVPQVRCLGPAPEEGSPAILNVSFPGLKGEVLVRMLSERQVYVSTGSACSSRRTRVSHVLRALKLPPEVVDGAIRISLSPRTPDAVIDEAIPRIAGSVHELQRMMGIGTKG